MAVSDSTAQSNEIRVERTLVPMNCLPLLALPMSKGFSWVFRKGMFF